MICILGIDPGAKGALAFFFPEHNRMSVEDMPMVGNEVNVSELADRIRQMAPNFAILEKAGPQPVQGAKAAFGTGMTYMAAKAVITLCGVSLEVVPPAVWKKHFKLSGKAEGKEQSRALAIQKFPAIAKSFARKLDHDRAEAALLALWGADEIPAVMLGREAGASA